MLELPSKCFPVPIEVLVQVLQLLLCSCLDFPDVQASFAFCPTKFVLMGGGSKSGPGVFLILLKELSVTLSISLAKYLGVCVLRIELGNVLDLT